MIAILFLTILIIFIVVYFLVIPMVVHGPEQIQSIWSPWCRQGVRGHWNTPMRQCAQHVLNTIKPPEKRDAADDDIIDTMCTRHDFYSFMKSCFEPQSSQ